MPALGYACARFPFLCVSVWLQGGALLSGVLGMHGAAPAAACQARRQAGLRNTQMPPSCPTHATSPAVKAWVRYAKFEMKSGGDVAAARACYERSIEELGEDANNVRAWAADGMFTPPDHTT